MPFNIFGANSVSGYTVKNSLRFNGQSSDYLYRNSNNNTEPTKVTWSFWTKRTSITDTRRISTAMTSGFAKYHYIRFEDGILNIYNSAGTGYALTQQFRDVGAWYHIVVSIDTTLATSTDRVKIYVNGSQVTAFTSSTAPTQNAGIFIGETSNAPLVIGTLYGVGYGITSGSPTEFYSGYLSEYYLIDGQALTPSSFGETDTDTGIWKPKAYTGTYGTNGFYLKFANSASLGTDSSGNGNNFTVNNLTSVDQSTDTPTNNFCTLNPLISVGNDAGNKQILSEGNLYVTGNQASWCHSRGTIPVTSGKWYWEAKWNAGGVASQINIGISNSGTNMFGGTVQSSTGNTSIYLDGQLNINGTITSGNFTSFSIGDIVGVAFNADASTVTFYKNGSAILSNQSVSGGNDSSWLPASAIYNTSNYFSFNFGSPIYTANGYTDGAGFGNFSYAVPSGYYALCTKNLANFG